MTKAIIESHPFGGYALFVNDRMKMKSDDFLEVYDHAVLMLTDAHEYCRRRRARREAEERVARA